MKFPKMTSKTGKIAILLLGVLILGVGLHSYFQSAWMQKKGVILHKSDGSTTIVPMMWYKICDGYYDGGKPCPDISKERYFVAMIIITFLLSLLGFIAGCMFSEKWSQYKLVDIGYHVVSAVLLFIAAIVFMISAVQAQNVWTEETRKNNNFRKSEKIFAGLLTIIQSFFYASVGFLLFREGQGS